MSEFAEGMFWTSSAMAMTAEGLRCPRCGFEHAPALYGVMGDSTRMVCDRCFHHPGWNEKAES